ncbi:MAG: hypothetical protein KDB03_07070 [Planctomycetales bacterium]|nr:hypothetical protein [Planctomycetales bacterium]
MLNPQILTLGFGLMVGLTIPNSTFCLAQGQTLPNVHYLLNSNQPPGAVASMQVARGNLGVGTFQAVSLIAPPGTQIALARDGMFLDPIDAPVTTAMLVGSVYRFRVTGIPFQTAEEVFPTLEIIDRTFAPNGREHRFPIPIVLTLEDLRLALDGALVTRVIYLEDSEIAEPVALAPGEQRVIDVEPNVNALKTADQLGRPMAILRIGSRTPADLNGDLSQFLFGCPPWMPLPVAPSREGLIQSGLAWPAATNVVPATEKNNEPIEDTPKLESY